MDEYRLLIYLLELCEKNGQRYDQHYFDIDNMLIENLYEKYQIEPTLEELQQVVDRCYARSWLEHAYMSGSQYKGLKLTTTGSGVATSKRKSDEAKNSRPFLKKASDYIEEHKGLFVLLGSLIAITGLLITISKGGG